MNLTVSQKAKLYTGLIIAAVSIFVILLAMFPDVMFAIFALIIGLGCLAMIFYIFGSVIYESFTDWLEEKNPVQSDPVGVVEPNAGIPQADIDFVRGLIENFSPVEIKALKFVLEREEL